MAAHKNIFASLSNDDDDSGEEDIRVLTPFSSDTTSIMSAHNDDDDEQDWIMLDTTKSMETDWEVVRPGRSPRKKYVSKKTPTIVTFEEQPMIVPIANNSTDDDDEEEEDVIGWVEQDIKCGRRKNVGTLSKTNQWKAQSKREASQAKRSAQREGAMSARTFVGVDNEDLFPYED